MISRRCFTKIAAALTAQTALPQGSETAAYHEKLRPQFHFSPRKGWTNDPNGLVFYQGEYHLFFQHNPFDTKWGNMTWGHATSPDLVHWKQGENALLPDKMGTMYSGSAVVDEVNTAGFQQGNEKTLVNIYTAAGGNSPESQGQPFTQCIAYSTDRGRTWTKYSGNPVVRNMADGNRDPKVVWHVPTRKWVMILYLEGNAFRFLNSPDLKTWTTLHDIVVPGCAECPDFFEMSVDGEPGVNKWIWTSADDHYLIGSFDGQHFVAEYMTNTGVAGGNYYAVQTYSGIPGGRRIQLSWMKDGQYPDMPFNQQMSFPYELKLRRFGSSLKLCSLPVKEIASIQREPKTWTGVILKPGENALSGLSGELWDIQAEFEAGEASELGFTFRGHTVTYSSRNARSGRLSNGTVSAGINTAGKPVKLRILVDRTTVEVFANDGEVVMPVCFVPKVDDPTPKMILTRGSARISSLQAYELKSIWS